MGSGDFYKTPEGKYVKRLGDIPPGCIFTRKVRVHEKIDDELDMCKCFHEDGIVGSIIDWDTFDFISHPGKRVTLEGDFPKGFERFIDIEGDVKEDPGEEVVAGYGHL